MASSSPAALSQRGSAASSPVESSVRSSGGDLAGWALVKRRAFERRRRRYLKLSGSVLTCQRGTKGTVEWDASLLGCTVRAATQRGALRITFANGARAWLALRPRHACPAWVEAIKLGSSRKFEDLYEIYEKIGEGGFAQVHAGRDLSTGEKVAIKIIKKNTYDMQAMRELEREIQTLKTLTHPRIVKTHDIFHVQDRVYIVMELMEGGTLKDRIQAVGGSIPEAQARTLIRETLEGCVYLHSNNVVHRDIKLENVLCKGKTMPQSDTKLADFGYANFVHDTEKDTLRSLVGTPLYVASEVIQRKPYGAPVDIYACGIMTYRMIAGSYPYNAEDDEQTMQLAVQGRLSFAASVWRTVSSECISFLKSTLNTNPQTRLTAAAALHHAWFAHVDRAKRSREHRLREFSQKISRFGQRITTDLTKLQLTTSNTLAHSAATAAPQEPSPEALRRQLRIPIIATIFAIRLGVASGVRPPLAPRKARSAEAEERPQTTDRAGGFVAGRKMMDLVRSLSFQIGQKTATGLNSVRNHIANSPNLTRRRSKAAKPDATDTTEPGSGVTASPTSSEVRNN